MTQKDKIHQALELWIHTLYLLVGSINCWFLPFHGIWQQDHWLIHSCYSAFLYVFLCFHARTPALHVIVNTKYIGIFVMMCLMHEFAYTWPPVIALNCICAQASVCLCKSMCVFVCACKRSVKQTLWRQMAPVPSTPMFEHCSCRRIASLAACVFCCGCVPPCVCVPWQCVTLRSDRDWCCGPWWYQREERQQTESSGLTWEHPRQHTREVEAQYKVTAELKVIHSLTHCCFYHLIKDTLIFPKVRCGCVWKVHSLVINYLVQLWHIVFIFEE